MLIECNRPTSSRLLTFVDNFTWLAAQKQALRQSLRVAQDVCGALCLLIDWRKSFAWGTTPALRQYWDREAQADLPQDVELRRAKEAMDLGVGLCFQTKRLKGKADLRLMEGKQRLDRLRRQSRPLDSKVRLLLGGVWPQCLYGMHGKLLPKVDLDQLRSKAAKALCQAGSSQSPYLILWSVAPAIADPEVFLMVQSAIAVRRLFLVGSARADLVLQGVLPQHSRPCSPGAGGRLRPTAGATDRGCLCFRSGAAAANTSVVLFSLPGLMTWEIGCPTAMASMAWGRFPVKTQ